MHFDGRDISEIEALFEMAVDIWTALKGRSFRRQNREPNSNGFCSKFNSIENRFAKESRGKWVDEIAS